MIVTILCVKPRKFKLFAWLIQRFTKAGFSHVSVTMKDEWLQLRKVFDAVGAGIRMSEYRRFMSHYMIVKAYTAILEDTTAKDMESRAVKALGQPYSFKGVLAQAWRVLTHKNKKFRDGLSTLYCSEFATWLVEPDSLTKGEDMNLDEFDEWIAARWRPVPQVLIERINDDRLLDDSEEERGSEG